MLNVSLLLLILSLFFGCTSTPRYPMHSAIRSEKAPNTRLRFNFASAYRMRAFRDERENPLVKTPYREQTTTYYFTSEHTLTPSLTYGFEFGPQSPFQIETRWYPLSAGIFRAVVGFKFGMYFTLSTLEANSQTGPPRPRKSLVSALNTQMFAGLGARLLPWWLMTFGYQKYSYSINQEFRTGSAENHTAKGDSVTLFLDHGLDFGPYRVDVSLFQSKAKFLSQERSKDTGFSLALGADF